MNKKFIKIKGLTMAYVDEGSGDPSAKIPKLFIEAIPGMMLESHRQFARSWPSQQHVQIKGGHFVQEDSPHEVGEAIASWMKINSESDYSPR